MHGFHFDFAAQVTLIDMCAIKMKFLCIYSCIACLCVTEFMHEDERGLYEKLSEILNEDEVSTVIDLPGKKHTFKSVKLMFECF